MTDALDTLFFLGRPLSPFYSSIMRLRSFLYQHGLLKSEKMAVPVLSIGNLTLGGTGKTPAVHYLADFLLKKGYRPAIISRGYGGTSNAKINVVSNGQTLLMDAEEAGDEPRLLAETLPTIPIVTGKRRVHPCRYAIEQLHADVLILDDGFQHISVKRDVNFVLFSAATLNQYMKVFPGGTLREPFSALSRASALVITGVNEERADDIQRFKERFQKNFPQKPVFLTSYSPQHAIRKGDEAIIQLEELPSSLHGFCGIASPLRFQKSLADHGIHLNGFTALRDHQEYTPELLCKIEKTALETGCKGLVTTEKDMVKLSSLSTTLPLYTIVMKFSVNVNFNAFVLQHLHSL